MIAESDLVVIFASDLSEQKKITQPVAEASNKDAIIILTDKVFKTISNTMPNSPRPDPIRKEELISEKEELELINLAQSGYKPALNRLIKANNRLVKSLARTCLKDNPSTTLDELVSKGNRGLEAACMNFDPKRGFKFSAFAVWFIRKAITQTNNL